LAFSFPALPCATPFPYTTLFRSCTGEANSGEKADVRPNDHGPASPRVRADGNYRSHCRELYDRRHGHDFGLRGGHFSWWSADVGGELDSLLQSYRWWRDLMLLGN